MGSNFDLIIAKSARKSCSPACQEKSSRIIMIENLTVSFAKSSVARWNQATWSRQTEAGAAHNLPDSLVHVSRPLLLLRVTDLPLIAALSGGVCVRLIRQRLAPADWGVGIDAKCFWGYGVSFLRFCVVSMKTAHSGGCTLLFSHGCQVHGSGGKRGRKKKGGASSCVIARVFKEWWTLVNGAAGVITVQESQKARLCAIWWNMGGKL